MDMNRGETRKKPKYKPQKLCESPEWIEYVTHR